MTSTTAEPIKTAAEIVAKTTDWGKEAKAALRADMTPAEYLSVLVEQELFADALAFLARSMSLAEAVWWSCLISEHAIDPASPAEDEALRAAVAWLREPDSVSPKQLDQLAEKSGPTTPAGCSAKAAFFAALAKDSEGANATRMRDSVASLAYATVLFATDRLGAEKADDWYCQYLAIGIDVVHGRNSWLLEEQSAAAK